MSSTKKYDFEDAINTFFLDCREMLEEMEGSLLEIEKDRTKEEAINALFRAIHTIKGSAGMFGFDVIEKFTHVMENLLDDIRKGKVAIDSDLIAIFLECHDHIDLLVRLYDESRDATPDVDMSETSNRLVQMLKSYLPGYKKTEKPVKEKESEPAAKEEEIVKNEAQVLNECWHISIRFDEDVFRNGLDPMPFIKYLKEMGKIVNIVTVTDSIPSLGILDPESCYLGLEIDFKSDVKKSSIEAVFEFLMEDCKIRIVPPNSNISEYVKLIQDLPESPARIGEILTEAGTLTEAELKEALNLQGSIEAAEGEEAGAKKPLLGEIVVEEKMVLKPVLNAAIEKQEQNKKAEEKKKRSIRIDALKLDHLMNFVGELVITGANVKQLSEKTGNMDLIEAVSVMSRLIEDIRDSTMNVRMVQIGEIFRKFERVVRDLSREQGKEIDLVISGGDTELDKTLIEKINDPLVHLVRNAIDHGIDTPNERIAKGKPEKGTISLTAYHETGCIVIEIQDDGNGLNKEKIRQKAVEKGYILQNQDFPEKDLFQLIFEPGFSTAEKVTNISGRGVGMDVVRRNIQSIRGTITLESEEGEGTTVRIDLPLTLAIIDGFMVEVGNTPYVVPLDMVIECSKFSEKELQEKDTYNFINLRGEVLPYLSLRKLFSQNKEKAEIPDENIIIVEYAGRKVGLVVDKLLGGFQTVVKPLGKIFSKLQWTIGATILGTGEVALILDVPMLIKHVQSIEMNTPRRETVEVEK